MDNSPQQSPDAILMVRPKHFFPNDETAADNKFQAIENPALKTAIHSQARAAFDAAVHILEREGVKVYVLDDRDDVITPDSVFPNNWFSCHHNGTAVFYPMHAHSRRLERRPDVLDLLAKDYNIKESWDLSPYENDGKILEGTGALVLDNVAKVAYMTRSKRANEDLLNHFCQHLGYSPFVFDSFGPDGDPIYHTNVVMGIGAHFAMVGLECVKDSAQRHALEQSLTNSDKEIISLSMDQINQFAGNVFELNTPDGPIVAMSQSAYNSLNHDQLTRIEAHAKPLPLSVPTIEKSGGSVRCMMAAIHLPRLP